MNKVRRVEIQLIIDTLTGVKDDLWTIADEEMESYDNLPESIQESDRGQQSFEFADTLSDKVSELELMIEEIGEVIA